VLDLDSRVIEEDSGRFLLQEVWMELTLSPENRYVRVLKS
jgi:hypothetical protein